MSKPRRYLPPEILDEIVSFLQDEPETLMQCCLVSKSWIPRTRKHLFAQIEVKDHLEWMRVFPDLTNSPAHYARRLTVDCAPEDSYWIRGFSRVEQLILNCDLPDPGAGIISFIPFHNLAASLRSLCVASDVLPRPQIFDLIRLLPLLEDLTLKGDDIDEEPRGPPAAVSSPTSPVLTGALELSMYEGMERTLPEMLNLPGGLHFRELQLSWCGGLEFPWVAKLVAACSDTLERLDIDCDLDYEFPGSVDLSKATKLKDIVFRCGTMCCKWIVVTLKTITPKHQNLRIFLHAPYASGYQILNPEAVEAGEPGMRWLDLDRFLVQLWESHSIFLNVVSPQPGEKAKRWIEYLLPEVARRGTAELEESRYIGDCFKTSGWQDRSRKNQLGREDGYVFVVKLGNTRSGRTSFV